MLVIIFEAAVLCLAFVNAGALPARPSSQIIEEPSSLWSNYNEQYQGGQEDDPEDHDEIIQSLMQTLEANDAASSYQQDSNEVELEKLAEQKKSGMDHLLSLEDELDSSLQSHQQQYGMSKRAPFSVDFMGMRVSYPQYLRLMALQEKVVKLDQLIHALQSRYSAEQLAQLPQYARLVSLHSSLAPLLPQNARTEEEWAEMDSNDGAGDSNSRVEKRSPFTVQFMDMQVSYPQYLRLVALQEKVIKLDQLLRKMKSMKPIEELEKMPQWHRLISLHGSLKKLLPADYVTGQVKRSGTVEFNGVRVSLPQYMRLMELQQKVMKLDTVLRRLSTGVDPEKLAASTKWNKLVSMRQSLQKLLPEDHPEFEIAKRADFNGVQVSYPQYVHLMSLQKKVMALNAAMKKIASKSSLEKLEKMPTWHKLTSLRESLTKLMPQGQEVQL